METKLLMSFPKDSYETREVEIHDNFNNYQAHNPFYKDLILINEFYFQLFCFFILS